MKTLNCFTYFVLNYYLQLLPSKVSPQSLCNRSFGGVFYVVTLLFGIFSVGVGAFVMGLSQISPFFSSGAWIKVEDSYCLSRSSVQELLKPASDCTTGLLRTGSPL